MKVLVFANESTKAITPKMKEIMDKTKFPRNRVGEIVDFVESTAKELHLEDPENEIKKGKGEIFHFPKSNIYYTWGNKWIREMVVVEVDTSRPWCIDAEFGMPEEIKYLDYTVADEELNYCEISR